MHELSISSAIVDTAIKHARGQRVTVVDVRLGRLRQVVPDSLAFYFDIVSRETPCEGAELRIEHVDSSASVPRLLVRVGPRAAADGDARGVRDGRPAARAGVSLPHLRRARRGPDRGRAGGRVDRDHRRGTGARNPVDLERGTHAPHEDQGRRGRARRERDDRAGQPRRLRPQRGARRQPDERSGRRQDDAPRVVASRLRPPRRRARGRRAGLDGRRPHRRPPHPGRPAQHGQRLRRRVPPGRQHGPLGDPGPRPRRRSTSW